MQRGYVLSFSHPLPRWGEEEDYPPPSGVRQGEGISPKRHARNTLTDLASLLPLPALSVVV